MMPLLTKEYRIPHDNFKTFISKIDNLNRKAQKLHCTPIVANVIKTDNEKQEDGSIIVYRTVAILGEAPMLNNWVLSAIIQHLGTPSTGIINVIRTVPGMSVDVEYYHTASSNCYHCNVDRLRKETFVVSNIVTGAQNQVGRSCLRDFTGHSSPHTLAAWAEELSIFDEWCENPSGGYSSGSKLYPLKDYLEWVTKNVREYGWVSATHAREEGGVATAHRAWSDMIMNKSLRDINEFPTYDDIKLTEQIYTYIRKRCLAADFNPVNDYMSNIQSIARADIVDSKLIGLAASMYIVHANHMKREIAKANRVDLSRSHHLGSPGDKLTFDALVLSITPFDSSFGVSELISLVDEDGNVLVWMKSPGSKYITELTSGKRVVAYGTIKKHNEYKGIKQTVLTRCKILEVYDDRVSQIR